MYDINTVNLAKSLIPFVGWFPDTQINNTSRNILNIVRYILNTMNISFYIIISTPSKLILSDIFWTLFTYPYFNRSHEILVRSNPTVAGTGPSQPIVWDLGPVQCPVLSLNYLNGYQYTILSILLSLGFKKRNNESFLQ